jgi:DNA-binding winged helix-turn-helix (wHTH) protein/tetratricopeptide (TPR) repeat protein
MSAPSQDVYEFGDFRLDAGKRLLLRRGEPVPLTPKVFDTLLHLVQHHGKVIAKDDLMHAVWPDTAVEENNLNQNISTLRRVFGENRGENRYIATVPGKGYHFIPAVEVFAGPAPSATGRVTVGVLPFRNLGADPDREYLADGLTEEVIATLGQIDASRLSVIGRTTMMAYKRANKTLAEIGRELGAAYLIESSMRSEGGHLRITSNLIRVPDQVQIWSMSYDSEPSSMLQFQREISVAIGEQVRLRLSPERLSALGRRQTRNPEAYDLYLRGRYFWNQLSRVTTRRATEFFARATTLDPQYALAWSGLADAYTASPINGDAPPLAVWPLAREAAAHAINARPDLAESQTSSGFVKFWFDWDWPAGEAAFRRAIDLDPHYPLAHRLMGIVLAHMRRHEEAAAAVRRARELDPLLAGHHALSSQIAFMARDYATALQFAKQSITIDPEFWIGYMQLGQAYEQLGEPHLALDALNDAARLSGGNSKALSLRGYIFARTARTQSAHEVLDMLDAVAREHYVPRYASALIYLGLGQLDQAIDCLARAFEMRDVHLAFLPTDVKWDPLRQDPRFIALLKQCGFVFDR